LTKVLSQPQDVEQLAETQDSEGQFCSPDCRWSYRAREEFRLGQQAVFEAKQAQRRQQDPHQATAPGVNVTITQALDDEETFESRS